MWVDLDGSFLLAIPAPIAVILGTTRLPRRGTRSCMMHWLSGRRIDRQGIMQVGLQLSLLRSNDASHPKRQEGGRKRSYA